MPVEHWMRGPVEGVAPLLQPVAHALLQATEDVAAVIEPLSPAQIWARPTDAASAGFHVKHLAGALDRLLTYARGEALTADQLAWLKAEAQAGDPPADAAALVTIARGAIDRAMAQIRQTPEALLLEPRYVGRQRLPSDVLGLLFHAAEHTTRHVGQLITTVKLLKTPAS
jgi:hypothetical protein